MTTPTTFWRLAGVSYVQVRSSSRQLLMQWRWFFCVCVWFIWWCDVCDGAMAKIWFDIFNLFRSTGRHCVALLFFFHIVLTFFHAHAITEPNCAPNATHLPIIIMHSTLPKPHRRSELHWKSRQSPRLSHRNHSALTSRHGRMANRAQRRQWSREINAGGLRLWLYTHIIL
jgi:hypothetical protein